MQPLAPLILLIHQGNTVYTCLNALLDGLGAVRNFHIAFINFAKTTTGVEVLEDKLSAFPKHYTIYDVPMSSDDLNQLDGVLGYILNRAMLAHECDFAFILRDCDEVHPRYITNVSNHFLSNRASINSCFSHVIPMNANRTVIAHSEIKKHRFNYMVQSINANGMNNLHVTQLAWRLDLCRNRECLFNQNSTNDITNVSSFVNKLYEVGGSASYTGGISHYFNESAPDIVLPDPELAKTVSMARQFMLASDFVNARLSCIKALTINPNCVLAHKIMQTVSPPKDVVGAL